MAASMKMFWDVAEYNVVEVDRRFRGSCCLHHQGYRKAATFQKTVIFMSQEVQ
jgi:hypothetical protein